MGSKSRPLPDKDEVIIFFQYAGLRYVLYEFPESFPVEPFDPVPLDCSSCFPADGKADSVGVGSVFSGKENEISAGKPAAP